MATFIPSEVKSRLGVSTVTFSHFVQTVEDNFNKLPYFASFLDIKEMYLILQNLILKS